MAARIAADQITPSNPNNRGLPTVSSPNVVNQLRRTGVGGYSLLYLQFGGIPELDITGALLYAAHVYFSKTTYHENSFLGK